MLIIQIELTVIVPSSHRKEIDLFRFSALFYSIDLFKSILYCFSIKNRHLSLFSRLFFLFHRDDAEHTAGYLKT